MDINEIMDLKTKQKNINENLDKIMAIFEKSSSAEIAKTTSDSIVNIILEEPLYFISFLSQCLSFVQKGKISIVKDFKFILEQLGKEIDEIQFFKQLLRNIGEELFMLTEKKPNLKYFTLTSEGFISIETLNLNNSTLISNLDVKKIKLLYNPKNESQSNESINEFDNEMNMKILIGNNADLKKEFEANKNNIQNLSTVNEDDGKVSLEELYKTSSKIINLEENLVSIKPIIKINEKMNLSPYYHLIYCPVQGIISSLLSLNHSNMWEIRICSTILLSTILKSSYLMTQYQIDTSFQLSNDRFYCIESLVLKKLTYFINEELEKDHIITRLVINSCLDMVSDFSDSKNVCLFKELNNNLAIKTLKTCNNLQKEKIVKNIVILFTSLINDTTTPWPHLYSIVYFFKVLEDYSSEYMSNLNFPIGFLKIYPEIVKREDLEVTSVANSVIVGIFTELSFDEKNLGKVLKNVSSYFLSSADNFDDIEYSIQNYLQCFLKLIEFGLFKLEDEDERIKISKFCQSHLIKFALNQLTKVRSTFYLVISNLIIYLEQKSQFLFNDEFMKCLNILAYQGLVMEDNKEVQQALVFFTTKVLFDYKKYSKSLIAYLSKNMKPFYKLLVYDNIKNLKNFYIPEFNSNLENSPSNFYNSFILNDLQQNEVLAKKVKRQILLHNYFADLIVSSPDMFPIMLKTMYVELSKLTLSSNIINIFKIYSIYLEKIFYFENKVLFIPHFTSLFELIEPNGMSELKVQLEKSECLDLKKKSDNIMVIKNLPGTFNSFIFLLANYTFDFKLSTQLSIDMKSFLDNFHVKVFLEKIQSINKKYEALKVPFRSYLASVLLQSYEYSGQEIKKTHFINSFLNYLKINSESSAHISRIFLKLILKLDKIELVNKVLADFIKNCCNSYLEENKNEKIRPKSYIN